MFKCKETVLLKCYIVVFHCPRWYICLEIIDNEQRRPCEARSSIARKRDRPLSYQRIALSSM